MKTRANKRGAGKGGFAALWRAGRAWPALPDRERWTRMRNLLITFAFSLVMAGCATAPKDVRAVWTEPTPPSADVAVPAGFTITPTQAFAAARESGMISLKHVWHIYADTEYYYVHDTFLGDSPRLAYLQGVRIDGQTGQVAKR